MLRQKYKILGKKRDKSISTGHSLRIKARGAEKGLEPTLCGDEEQEIKLSICILYYYMGVK